MSPTLVAAILSAIIPELVQEAEKAFGANSGPQKRQWVEDGVHSVLGSLENHVPGWAGTAIAAAEPLIDEGIELALSKTGLK